MKISSGTEHNKQVLVQEQKLVEVQFGIRKQRESFSSGTGNEYIEI
jgi:hypothetical protein